MLESRLLTPQSAASYEGFRHGFAARTGSDEAELAARAVTDPVATVQADVERLLSAPLATPRIVVSGHLFNLNTGLVPTVVPATAPRSVQEQVA